MVICVRTRSLTLVFRFHAQMEHVKIYHLLQSTPLRAVVVGAISAFFYNRSLEDCQDIDECALETVNCSSITTCINTVGSYKCVCNSEFNGTGGSDCTDIDECSNPNACDVPGSCVNLFGSYFCEQIGRAVQQECRDRSRMPSSA
eukprot:TRINITY_DN52578_c0_g2_i1.p1 TRINITY_DN52578_c0_g2~~TRINITY_DN52578_c0_g2_i1.p1  ORF type:complete len:145 (+),score=7.85 TRINITY_DN52578_c0_g2_i1:89-523(+)